VARSDFITQLQTLGFSVQDCGGDRLSFNYVVPVGKFADRQIQLGFIVSDDFPMNPPSGPHLSPPLLPRHPGGDLPHPAGGVHESPFGSDWQYWSRPFSEWSQTDRSVRAYMAFIRNLFLTQ
jgi:Prokaryotic E2 family E